MVRFPRRSFRPRRARRARRPYLNSVSGITRVRRGLMRSAVGLIQPLHFFKRTTYTNAWIGTTGGADTFKTLSFKLSDLPSYQEFTALYDQYCIKGVKFTLMPRFNSSNPGLNPITPQTWSILDYDNSGTNITSQNEMLQYQNLKMIPGTSYHKRYIVPAVDAEIYNGLAVAAAAPQKNVFLDTANASVEHFGVRIMIPAVPFGSEQVFWDLKVKFYLAMKNVR